MWYLEKVKTVFVDSQSTFDVVTMKAFLDDNHSPTEPLYIEAIHLLLNESGFYESHQINL